MIEQQKNDISELLEDIRFVNQVTELEIQRVGEQLKRRIAENVETTGIPDLVLDELSSELGQLSARLKLSESVIESMRPSAPKLTAAASEQTPATTDSSSTQRIGAEFLAGRSNFLNLEHSQEGVSYCWSSSAPEIDFTVTIDRTRLVEMQIGMYSLIKPEFSRQMKIFVDDVYCKHRFYKAGPLFFASCRIPAKTSGNETKVQIILPDTYSPMEIGDSQDGRKLGIAISEIRFGKPGNAISYLLQKLRSRS